MRKTTAVVILAFIALAVGGMACTLPAPLAVPTETPTLTPTATLPPPTPTLTPTALPTATPTPIPAQRIANGDQALYYGDYEAALQAYTEGLTASTDPELQSAALLGQGRVYFEDGYYPGALDALRAVTENYPDSPYRADAFFFLGETYMALNRFVEAADAYLNYWMLRPGVIDAYIGERRGDALFNAGSYSQAMMDYQAAVNSERLPSDFVLEIKLARAYAASGDYSTALVMYNDLYSRTGNDYLKAQIDYLLGQMYANMGQTQDAYTAYLDAVDNYPLAYYAYLSLVELVNAGYPVDELQRGIVDYHAGEYGAALAAFERYLSGAPADPKSAAYYKGLILRSQIDYAGAVAQWDTILQGSSDHPLWDEAWEQKGYTLWAFMDRYADGQQTLLDFVNAAPGHPRAAEFLFDAARVAERDQRLEEAARLWERMSVEYPNSDYVLQSLMLAGLARYRLGDYGAAQSDFWLAQSLATDQTERAAAYFWLGKTAAAQGDDSTALANFQQTAALDPTGYYSERSRDLISGRPPFAPPEVFDVGQDRTTEIAEAENWMRQTFGYPTETDFSVPGGLDSDPRYQRGKELWRLGLYAEAVEEFDTLREEVAGDPINSYRIALMMEQIGAYRQAVLAARRVLDLAGMNDASSLTAPALFSHLRFGTYFSEIVIPAAEEFGFHPLFVWSVMRQESLFEPFVDSAADARGLMQIIPPTGADIAGKMGWPPDYVVDDLYRPLISLRMGLFYLAGLRDAFGGDVYAALAAYNGGPGNASAWLELANGDPDLFLESIRFDETRRYLMGIYEIFDIYHRIYERTP
jgi:soluble lytic murein transglycosylase